MKRIATIVALALLTTVAALAAPSTPGGIKSHVSAPHDRSPKMRSHAILPHK